MAGRHDLLKMPDDPKTMIWRYMDFAKFVALIEDRQLVLSRSDLLGDPFEGSFSKTHLRALNALSTVLPQSTQSAIEQSKSAWLRERQWTYISCWHMNETESEAMRRQYAARDKAICIQSTVERLDRCLPEYAYIAEVQYIDYDKDPIPGSEDNTFPSFAYKRKSFAHERELRAIYAKSTVREDGKGLHQGPDPAICSFPIDVSNLIEKVYVSPMSPGWFRELICKVMKRYSLDAIPVVPSSLDDEPLHVMPISMAPLVWTLKQIVDKLPQWEELLKQDPNTNLEQLVAELPDS